MTIPVTCEGCGKTYGAKDAYAGRKGRCPKCGAAIEVPAAADTVEPVGAGRETPTVAVSQQALTASPAALSADDSRSSPPASDQPPQDLASLLDNESDAIEQPSDGPRRPSKNPPPPRRLPTSLGQKVEKLLPSLLPVGKAILVVLAVVTVWPFIFWFFFMRKAPCASCGAVTTNKELQWIFTEWRREVRDSPPPRSPNAVDYAMYLKRQATLPPAQAAEEKRQRRQEQVDAHTRAIYQMEEFIRAVKTQGDFFLCDRCGKRGCLRCMRLEATTMEDVPIKGTIGLNPFDPNFGQFGPSWIVTLGYVEKPKFHMVHYADRKCWRDPEEEEETQASS